MAGDNGRHIPRAAEPDGAALGLTGEATPDDPDAIGGLIELAASGDDDAWRKLVHRFGRRVYALVASRIRGPELAEEITQSVFVTVARQLAGGSYTEVGRFESWLFRIAMNRVRDEIRRQRRQATPADPGGMANRAAPSVGPDRPDAGELASLRSALDRLGEADREIIELRHRGQMGFKEMAAMLGEPVGTLLARHHRALRKLRRLLEADDEHAGPERTGSERRPAPRAPARRAPE